MMNGHEYLEQYETEDSKIAEISRLLCEGVYQLSGSGDTVSAWKVSVDNIMSIANRTEIGKSTTTNESLIKLGSALIDGMWIDMPLFECGKLNTGDSDRLYCFKHSLEKCMNEYRTMIVNKLVKDRKTLTKKINKLKRSKIKKDKDIKWMIVLG